MNLNPSPCPPEKGKNINDAPLLSADKVARLPYLSPVNFQVSAGEMVSVMGPSGVGKSVLLRALADLDPHQGQVALAGRPQSDWAPEHWRRQVMWFGAETAWWLPTVLAHFEAVLQWQQALGDDEECQEPFSKKVSQDLKKCQNPQSCLALKAYFEALDLPLTLLQQPIWQLSSGEKQRLALVRGLLLMPKVLLLDEITANLDQQTTLKVESVIADYVVERQAGGVWVTHSADQAERVAQRHFELSQKGMQLKVDEHV